MVLMYNTFKSRVLEIWGHSGFQKYFRNTGWLFGEKILRMFAGLFVGVWVARYLGPEQFGLFNYAISFAGLFTVISSFGLDTILVRELVKHKEKRDPLLGTVFVLKIIGALTSLIILALAVFFTGNTSFENILIFIVASAVIFQSFNVVDLYFQSKVLSKYVVYANVISLLITSVIKVFLILTNSSLIYFAIVILVDSLVLMFGYIYFYKKQGLKFFKWNFDKVVAEGLLKDSWPFIISGMAIMIYVKIDQVMIKNMLGDGAVGQYAAAVRLSEAWYFIPMIIASSLLPAIINAKKVSEKLYYERLQKFYDFMVLISITIAISMTFLSNWIVKLLYGVQYMAAGNVLMIHIWAGIFVFLGVANGRWMLIENLQKFSIINTVVGAIINILLNYILIKSYGIQGSAWATVISYAFSGYLMLLVFKKTRINFINLSKSLFFITAFKRIKLWNAN